MRSVAIEPEAKWRLVSGISALKVVKALIRVARTDSRAFDL